MPGKKGQNGRVYNRTVGMVKYAAVVLPFNSKATNLRHLLVVTPPPPPHASISPPITNKLPTNEMNEMNREES